MTARDRRHVDPRGARRRRVTLAAAGAVVVLAGAIVVVRATTTDTTTDGTTDRTTDSSTATPAAPPSASPSPVAEPTTDAGTGGPTGAEVPGPGTTAAVATPPGLRPVRVSIPSIGVDASTTDLGIRPDGTIEVPTDERQVGWLDTTPAPGQQGPAVLAAHVDSTTGPAVFYRLSALQPGADIAVTRADGSVARFTVDGTRDYPQADFPTAAVYGPVPGPALRLITCGGDYDEARGGYQDNVVVYAS